MAEQNQIVIQRPDTSQLPTIQPQTILALRVTDDQTLAQATEFAKLCRDYVRAVTDTFEKAVKAAHEAHKSLTALRAQLTAGAEVAEKHCRFQIAGYLAEQERKRLELQDRLRREQEEAAAKAAKEAEENAAPWEEPQIKSVPPAVIFVPQTAPAAEGLSTRKGRLSYEVTDFPALVRAAAERPELQDYLMVNDKMVKAKLSTVGEKIGEFIPGLKAVRDTSIVIR